MMTTLSHQEWLEPQGDNLSLLNNADQIEFESKLAQALPQAHTETEILKTVVRCALQVGGQDFENLTQLIYEAVEANPVQKRATLLLADQILKKNML